MFNRGSKFPKDSDLDTLKRCSSDSIMQEPKKKAKSTDLVVNSNNSLSDISDYTIEMKKRFVFKKASTIPTITQTVIPNKMNNALGHRDNSISSRTDVETHHGEETRHTNLEKPQQVSPSKFSYKRKFPGPAGLMPEQKKHFTPDIKSPNAPSKVDEICSQGICLKFTSGPWEQMLADYPEVRGRINLPEKYNIQWIKSGVLAKELHNQRTPFLAAFIHSINCNTSPNAMVNVVLKDKSGTIQGTILPKLYEQYCSELMVGSVLVLKQIGVLNVGLTSEPYLIITQNNLISIYTNHSEASNLQHSEKSSKIVVRNISVDDIYKSIDEMNCDKKSKKTIENSLGRCYSGKDDNNRFNSSTTNSKSRETSIEPSDKDDKIEELMIRFLEETENGNPNVQNKSSDSSKDYVKDNNYSSSVKTNTSKWKFHSANSPGLDEFKVNNEILQDMFEGLDTNLLFEDF